MDARLYVFQDVQRSCNSQRQLRRAGLDHDADCIRSSAPDPIQPRDHRGLFRNQYRSRPRCHLHHQRSAAAERERGVFSTDQLGQRDYVPGPGCHRGDDHHRAGSQTYGNPDFGISGANAFVTLTDTSGGSYNAPFTVNLHGSLGTSAFLPIVSGLIYNSLTGLYDGTLTLHSPSSFINSQATYPVLIAGLSGGVTLANADGVASDGAPFS